MLHCLILTTTTSLNYNLFIIRINVKVICEGHNSKLNSSSIYSHHVSKWHLVLLLGINFNYIQSSRARTIVKCQVHEAKMISPPSIKSFCSSWVECKMQRWCPQPVSNHSAPAGWSARCKDDVPNQYQVILLQLCGVQDAKMMSPPCIKSSCSSCVECKMQIWSPNPVSSHSAPAVWSARCKDDVPTHYQGILLLLGGVQDAKMMSQPSIKSFCYSWVDVGWRGFNEMNSLFYFGVKNCFLSKMIFLLSSSVFQEACKVEPLLLGIW